MILINNQPLNDKNFTFSGGEVSVNIHDQYHPKESLVTAYLYDSEEIMRLIMISDAMKRDNRSFKLVIPYLPYARQDRVCNEGEALGIKVMCDLINNLNHTTLRIYDPHSDVATALLRDVEVIEQHDILFGNIDKNKYDSLVSPDAGAEKKILKLSKIFGGKNVIFGAKVRDLATGNITSTRFTGDVEDKNLLIVDDICDGGRTFIELSKVLKEAGAKNVDLYVTHGIFSKGLGVLKPHFGRVYCYHKFPNWEICDNSFITTFNQ